MMTVQKMFGRSDGEKRERLFGSLNSTSKTSIAVEAFDRE